MRLGLCLMAAMIAVGHGSTSARGGEPTSTPASEADSKDETWMYVVVDQANVLPAPGMRARPRGRLARGMKVRIRDERADWFEVEEADGGVRGWVQAKMLSSTPPPTPKLSDQKLRQMIIDQSIAEYPGNCPCPYHADRAGRACGRRSAYNRPGGYSPKCYPRDVSQEEVERLRAELAAETRRP